jgi:hypothetical protein
MSETDTKLKALIEDISWAVLDGRSQRYLPNEAIVEIPYHGDDEEFWEDVQEFLEAKHGIGVEGFNWTILSGKTH